MSESESLEYEKVYHKWHHDGYIAAIKYCIDKLSGSDFVEQNKITNY